MKIKTYIKNNTHILVSILIIIQPIMDVISYWISTLGFSNSITTIFRLLIFFLTVLCGFIVSNKKSVYFIAITTIISIYLGHILACYEFGITDIIGDFANYTRIIVMPLSTISFISFIRNNEKTFDYLKKSLGIAFFIMVLVQILSTITGTDPHTYWKDNIGVLGWFQTASCQSANLSTLAPFFILLFLSCKKKKSKIFTTGALLTCLSMYCFATRLTYLGIISTMLGIGIVLFIINRNKCKEATILIVLAIIFAFLIPVSPMSVHRNNSSKFRNSQQIMVDNYLKKHTNYFETINNPTIDSENKIKNIITPIYNVYAGDFVDIFGVKKTIEMYNYSINVKDFANIRPKKLMFAKMLIQDSPISSKWFGVEFSRFTVGTNIYDVENDFHGIYYLIGSVGLITCILFIGYFVYLILFAITKNIKMYFTLDAAICGIAFLNNLAHIYNTCGVLRRPNSSIYLAAILALIYYLVKVKKYNKIK